MSRLYGLLEAGGTKFVLGLAQSRDDILTTTVIPTGKPNETLGAVTEWFRLVAARHGPLTAIGVASFGPLSLDPTAPDWGSITRTTKPDWNHTDIAVRLGRDFACPVGFDTDVNGAALGEYLWGAGQGQKVSLYLTIGTGIGGGVVIDGQILRGLSHPEMGHIALPRHPDDLDFQGVCPFHGDCLEGLASGPAIKARWGASLSELGPDHAANEIVAFYIAQACCTFQAIMEPGRIIIGGGVMGAPQLLDKVRIHATRLGRGYFCGQAEEVIVPPGLGDQAGLLGALALAQAASA